MSSGLPGTILQGTSKEKRRGRKKKWQNDIKEWTGIDFVSPSRAAVTGQDGKQDTVEMDCCEFIFGAMTTF